MHSKWIFAWPELPPLPAPGEPVLIRVITPAPRLMARQELRVVLCRVLAGWSGLAPGHLPLAETPRGPRWQGPLAGHSLGISLSYCDGEGWIGLVRGGSIGIDAMSAQTFAETELVARHYLGPGALAGIRQSRQPAQAFALAWTKLEACFKCLKLELTEWNAGRADAFAHLARREMFLGRTAVAVALAHG